MTLAQNNITSGPYSSITLHFCCDGPLALRPTRVLLLFEFPTVQGGERSIACLLQSLREQHNFEFLALAPEHSALSQFLQEHDVTCIGSLLSSTASLDERRNKVAERLFAVGPDLIHANSLATARLIGPTAKALGIPSVGHLRDIAQLSKQAIDDIGGNSLLIAVSNAVRDNYVTQGASEERIAVIYNGVDASAFAQRKTGWLRRELNVSESTLLLLNVGQICLRKGQDVLLSAAQGFPMHVDWRLLIVGSRHSQKLESVQFEQQLDEAANDAAIAGRVLFLGQRNDVNRLMAESDVLIHSARQEPLGRVLLEAAASRLCVVATDVGGTQEIFPPDVQSAILVPANHPEALASAVTRVMADSKYRAELASRAFSDVESRFSMANAVSQTADCYRQAISCQ